MIMADRQKKLFMKTFGCQMNVYDSEKMADLLKPLGFALTQSANDADLIIMNTCHIREKATEKVFSDLGIYKQIKQAKLQENKYVTIAVAGCVAQAEGEMIIKRAPFVDMVFGPQTYHHLPEMLAQIDRKLQKEEALSLKGVRLIDIDFPRDSKFDYLVNAPKKEGYTAFLSVQEGCDKFCTFCVVPYTRGAEVSRPVAEILKEAQILVDSGVKELTLLGQNVNAYHGLGIDDQEWSLARLIEKLAEIEGLARIRYTTSHPLDMNDDLIELHGTCQKLMPFLHLPVQSGSNRILNQMQRRHTREAYSAIIKKLRKACPHLALSSDFIVGFPGETEADFCETLSLVEEIDYALCYSFKYSPRPGTPASVAEDMVQEDVKQDRLQRLQELLNFQQDRFNKSFIGKTLDVLFEKQGQHPQQWVGRSPYTQPVHVGSPRDLSGQILPVLITEVKGHSLFGRMVLQEQLKAS